MASAFLSNAAEIAASASVLLAGIARKLGYVPGLLRTMGHAPAVLQGYIALRESMARTGLPTTLRERIAIAVASENGCLGCLCAHRQFGRAAGLDAAELDRAQAWEAPEPRDAAALRLARLIQRHAGRVELAEIELARAAGWNDVAMIEIAATVGMNALTNLISNLASLPPDFAGDESGMDPLTPVARTETKR